MNHFTTESHPIYIFFRVTEISHPPIIYFIRRFSTRVSTITLIHSPSVLTASDHPKHAHTATPNKTPSTTFSPKQSSDAKVAPFTHTTPQRLSVFDPTRRHYCSRAWSNMINKMPWDSESIAVIDDAKGKKEGGEASDRNEIGVKGKTDGGLHENEGNASTQMKCNI
jgi:hypothetical protein